jgi:hypothetical protein
MTNTELAARIAEGLFTKETKPTWWKRVEREGYQSQPSISSTAIMMSRRTEWHYTGPGADDPGFMAEIMEAMRARGWWVHLYEIEGRWGFCIHDFQEDWHVREKADTPMLAVAHAAAKAAESEGERK